MATVKVTDSSFAQDVLKSSEPVVVDFWAEWCGPCRMIGPALEEISDEMAGKVKIAKLNVDENPQVSSQLGIRSIPALMLFKDGKVVAQKVGAAPKGELCPLDPGFGIRPADCERCEGAERPLFFCAVIPDERSKIRDRVQDMALSSRSRVAESGIHNHDVGQARHSQRL